MTGYQPVVAGRRTTALNMAQYTNSYISGRQSFFNDFGETTGATGLIITFCYDNKVYQFFSFFFFRKRRNDRFNISFCFGNKNIFSTCCYSAVQCNIASISSLFFYNEKTIMGIPLVPYFISGAEGGIYSGVKPDSSIGSRHIL